MQQYSRKISGTVLLASLLVSGGTLRVLGQFSLGSDAGASIDSLEKEIATVRGGADWTLWDRYGQALRQQGDYARAATAFKRSLSLNPGKDAVSRLRFDGLLCVAQSHQTDAFLRIFARSSWWSRSWLSMRQIGRNWHGCRRIRDGRRR